MTKEELIQRYADLVVENQLLKWRIEGLEAKLGTPDPINEFTDRMLDLTEPPDPGPIPLENQWRP